MFFVESSENSHLCPVCQGILRYRDSRPRIRKKEGGVKERLMIRGSDVRTAIAITMNFLTALCLINTTKALEPLSLKKGSHRFRNGTGTSAH